MIIVHHICVCVLGAQGQHTRGVVDRWFGVDKIFRATGLSSQYQQNTHFATSNVFHIWYRFVEDIPN